MFCEGISRFAREFHVLRGNFTCYEEISCFTREFNTFYEIILHILQAIFTCFMR